MKKYDAILYVDFPESINEDDRRYASPGKGMSGVDKYFQGSRDWDDPKLYDRYSFGNTLKTALNSMGDEWFCEVTDFRKWVVVNIKHHNTITGRTSSKTYLVVFKQKGDGIVMSTHNRYRTISGVEQAISYIKSSASSLRDSNQTKI
jgi:hypothetical protein